MYKFLIISILSLFSVLCTQAQSKQTNKPETALKKSKPDSVKVSTPIFKNLRLDIDVAPILKNIFAADDTYSFETGLQANLLNKYYPIIELGYGGANHTSSTDIGFKTNGLFGRIGLDFNLLKQKEGKKLSSNLILAGLRLGYSKFNYDLTNIVINNDYWNEKTQYDILIESTSKLWFEIVFGVKVEISKNIYMGWTIRNKRTIKEAALGTLNPWFAPGYGINSSSNIGINYMIGYKF